MKKTEYGLTEAGFVAKTLSVILEEEKEAFRKAFGDDVDLSGESVAGAYVGNQAAKIAALWEQLEGLWIAGDRDSAGGVFLDRLAAFVNVSREPPKRTQVTACVWGAEGTQLLKGALAKLSTTGDIFTLSKSAEITRGRLLGAELSVAEAEGFSLLLNGQSIEIEAEAEDTKETLRDKLAEAVADRFGDIMGATPVGEDKLALLSTDGLTPFSAEASGALEITALGSPAAFAANDAGRIYVPSGTLSEMVTNVQGVERITNYATGITGREAESDTELRLSMVARQRQATATDPAIENAISKVNGVKYVRVYSNRSMETVNGRPPKSFESVVVGGDPQEIADAIFWNMPAGIEPFGNTHLTATDSQGFDWEIGFSRPVNRNIWIRVTLSLYDEEQFPDEGEAAVRENILNWGEDELGVDVDLIYQRLMKPIYAVPGIARADIRVAASADPHDEPDDSEFAAENIAIGEVEIAVLDAGRISVEVAP